MWLEGFELWALSWCFVKRLFCNNRFEIEKTKKKVIKNSKPSKSRCTKHVLGQKIVFGFKLYVPYVFSIPKFELFRNEKKCSPNILKYQKSMIRIWCQALVSFLKLSTSNWSDLDFWVGRCRQIAKNRTELPTVF